MSRFLKYVVVPAFVVTLAGCASGSASMAKRETNSMKVEALYVGTVEAIARRRGVDVRWVNPPREADHQIAKR